MFWYTEPALSWSLAELRGAASSYFKSRRDKNTRKNKGEVDKHRTLCRRQGRMRDKLRRRIETLSSTKCSEDRKETIKKALILGYTSSDESDLSEDENGDLKLKGYLVKKLPWERSALRKMKQELDGLHLRGLNPRVRGSFLSRRNHNELSSREYPNIVINWAVRRLADDQSNSTNDTPLHSSTPRNRLSKSV
ncbi:uncharacterized protein LOC116293893 [Actinia tenebrosa]|uniref:Uncharacterized protein LOC116293893 n=1 Tax=Actinia tenebrosa TaxID=6105 RepID=A0A6P8HX37_ACTTE|nr:uncharacterized protein LOC116293893 [Actinia tenebrosa]